MPGAEVDIRNVSRLFRLGSEDVWAVRDVTLSVASGEFLALVGRSGSGKTTLLNLIAGLDRPTGGEITVEGKRVDTMGEKELNEFRRHSIGFVFQSFGLLPLLSAQENVELPLRIAGYNHGARMKRTRIVLEMVGLQRRADHRPYELSGGEQQRVAIARALAIEPRLILADEPTGELDSATATAVFALLRELTRTEGITIVTCTHDRLVMERADRVEELADGRLVARDSRQVFQHISGRERSPFAASAGSDIERAEELSAPLSSLVGADTSQFRRPGRPGDDDALDHDAPAPEPPRPDDPDVSRWARPGR